MRAVTASPAHVFEAVMHHRSSARSRPFTARRVLALVAAVASGWAGYALYGQVAQDRAMADRVAQLTTTNAALQQQIDERLLEITEAKSPAWVEDQARKLGFHLPGETIYVVPPSADATPHGAGEGSPAATQGVPTPTPTPSASP